MKVEDFNDRFVLTTISDVADGSTTNSIGALEETMNLHSRITFGHVLGDLSDAELIQLLFICLVSAIYKADERAFGVDDSVFLSLRLGLV